MTQPLGRLERKKQRTRAALVDAALRLFAEKGYERTTVAEIAEAADVSTRTFFLHFPAKEHVLFLDSDQRVSVWTRALEERQPGETIGDVALRALEEVLATGWHGEQATAMAATRTRLIASTPALQSLVMQRFFAVQADWARALQEAYPDEIDSLEATALVGALIGAVGSAAQASIIDGAASADVRAAMSRAAHLAVKGTW